MNEISKILLIHSSVSKGVHNFFFIFHILLYLIFQLIQDDLKNQSSNVSKLNKTVSNLTSTSEDDSNSSLQDKTLMMNKLLREVQVSARDHENKLQETLREVSILFCLITMQFSTIFVLFFVCLFFWRGFIQYSKNHIWLSFVLQISM